MRRCSEWKRKVNIRPLVGCCRGAWWGWPGREAVGSDWPEGLDAACLCADGDPGLHRLPVSSRLCVCIRHFVHKCLRLPPGCRWPRLAARMHQGPSADQRRAAAWLLRGPGSSESQSSLPLAAHFLFVTLGLQPASLVFPCGNEAGSWESLQRAHSEGAGDQP